MIRERQLKISFIHNGKEVHYTAYKMHISYYEQQDFFRVQAKTGNRDLIKINGRWEVISGGVLPDELVQRVGKAIERSLESP